MEATFLGGADEIGRLGLVLKTGDVDVLLDYGLEPDTPPKAPPPAPRVDALLLTHAHLDHSGMVPAFAQAQEAPIWTSDITRRVAHMLHRDTLKIARIEDYPEPFPEPAIEQALTATRVLDPLDPIHLEGKDTAITPHLAGHIPGAVQFALHSADETVVFTGDLFTNATPLVPAGKPIPADVLFIETTYAGRRHVDRAMETKRFTDTVRATLDDGGRALIPAFATGRTQEVLLALDAALDDQETIWVDGMGGRVLDAFLDSPQYLHDAAALRRVKRRIRKVRNNRQRSHAAKAGRVVVTTSGMLDGGPVLHYLRQWYRDARSRVLLTGYQVEGTKGRLLAERGILQDRGIELKVQMPVDRFDLSTHLDHDAIVAYVEASQPRDVVLYHGYERELLRPDLEPLCRVHTPRAGQVLRFDA